MDPEKRRRLPLDQTESRPTDQASLQKIETEQQKQQNIQKRNILGTVKTT